MKTLSALFVAASVLVTPASAENSVDPDLVTDVCRKDGGRELCLVALSALRCHQYAFPLLPLGDTCAASTGALAKALDLKSHTIELEEPDGSFSTHDLTVIFTRRLVELLHDPAAQAFVKTLMTDLRRAGRDLTPFNLWEHSVKLSGGNEAMALERVAVLLQDTSRTRIQIFYLRHLAAKKQLNESAIEALGNLQVLQELIRDDRFREAGVPAWLTLYPPTQKLNESLNASPYHFYTMAFAAYRIRRAGVPSSFAAFLPFLFNTEYEFQQLDPEVWPVKNPRPFPADSNQWKLQDIYAGYTGALFGTGQLRKAQPYETFSTQLARNPKGKMRQLFFSLVF